MIEKQPNINELEFYLQIDKKRKQPACPSVPLGQNSNLSVPLKLYNLLLL
jgi:hypothetical protein